MEEWKYRRMIYYAQLSHDHVHSDDPELFDKQIIERFDKNHIIEDAINYGTVHQEDLYYPGKSYAIAIMYASWIEDCFDGTEFYTLLDDPELLPDDPYFVRYSEDKETYDKIIAIIDEHLEDFQTTDLPYVNQTYEYFRQEFMLDSPQLNITVETQDKDE